MKPKFRHMMVATLLSAWSWTKWGQSDSKAYLREQHESVMNSAKMRRAIIESDSFHTWKNVWPSYWEVQRELHNAEEMPSKYHSFVGVVTGAALAGGLFFILALFGVSLVI